MSKPRRSHGQRPVPGGLIGAACVEPTSSTAKDFVPTPAPAPLPVTSGRCSVCLGTVERSGGARVGGSCRCGPVKRGKP